MRNFKTYKWRFYWVIFGLMASLIIILVIFFEGRSWLGNVLQSICTIAGIYATILMYLQSKEESEVQFRKHLEHLQYLNNKETEALKEGTQKQVAVFQELNQEQIGALHQLTEKQIAAIQKATERQIEALQKSTFDQISAFERQTTEIATKLSDNSILLAEILGRELEKAISQTTATMEQAERDYHKLQEFQIGRTQQEKAKQLERQRGHINIIKQWIDYWSSKYNKLRGYFGFNEKLLNG